MDPGPVIVRLVPVITPQGVGWPVAIILPDANVMPRAFELFEKKVPTVSVLPFRFKVPLVKVVKFVPEPIDMVFVRTYVPPVPENVTGLSKAVPLVSMFCVPVPVKFNKFVVDVHFVSVLNVKLPEICVSPVGVYVPENPLKFKFLHQKLALITSAPLIT